MRCLRLLFALVLAPTLAGCFTIASTLTVHTDGSATLRDAIDLNGIGALAFAEEDGPGLVDKARLQARAEALGEGVTLIGVEEREGGFTAIYAVPDVRTLRYTMPSPPLGEDEGAETIADDSFDFTFGFEDGALAQLAILVPEQTVTSDTVDDAPELTDEAQIQARRGLEMARALLGDARVTVEVVLDGDVVETDAQFAEGDTVTLVDLSFDAVFDVMDEHPELMGRQSPPIREVQALLDDREGIEIQQPGTVTVQFR